MSLYSKLERDGRHEEKVETTAPYKKWGFGRAGAGQHGARNDNHEGRGGENKKRR